MLTKIVNGVEVQCTPQEEAAIRAEWAANQAKQDAVIDATLDAQAILKDETATTEDKLAAVIKLMNL